MKTKFLIGALLVAAVCAPSLYSTHSRQPASTVSLNQSSVQAVTRSEPKKQLNVATGLYKVVKSDSDSEDSFCFPGSGYTVEWVGSETDPMLSFGTVIVFNDFDKGLQTISEPSDQADACVERSNVQSQDSLLIQDIYSTCKNENSTEHTEVKFSADTIEYKKTTKITKKKKIKTLVSACTLKKR